MLKLGSLSLLTVFAVACEPILSAEIGNPMFRPDLVLIPIVAVVVTSPGPAAVFCAALIGLLCDCLTGPHLGPQMAAFGLVAAIGSLISLRPKSIVDVFLLSFACIFSARTAAMAARLTYDNEPLAATTAAAHIAGSSFVTALLLIAVLWLVRRAARPFVRHSWVAQTNLATLGWSHGLDWHGLDWHSAD
jgi:rod shape-determining protein MreD